MKKFNQKGITLIALVITIIILLILAGVSIAMLTGQNGVLTQAQSAKRTTENKNAEEKVKIAVMSARAQSDTASLEIDKLKAEIANQGGTATNNEFPLNVTMDGKSFTVASTGVVTAAGSTKPEEPTPNPPTADTISKSTSYVGYYADIDKDGTVDGVIYADLAVGNRNQGSGQWSDSNGEYTIPTVSAGSLKNYYISQESYACKFGTGAVISPTGTGTERFYIMALTDIKTNEKFYDWYNAAYSSGISDYSAVTSTGFGTGKTNTTTMITKWNAKNYGNQDTCSEHKDMWGQIQTKVNEGWFVPSKAEWLAFARELRISKYISDEKYYGNLGLGSWYWSSSLYSTDNAWCPSFYDVSMCIDNINESYYVRLSDTF